MVAAKRAALPNLPTGSGDVANAGLELDRFLRHAVGDDDGNAAVRDLLTRVTGAKPPDVYPIAFARWERMLATAEGELANDRFAARSRIIVGLGGEIVRETSIQLLRPYGVPVIPGSALKGLARHFAEHLAAGDPDHPLAPPRIRRHPDGVDAAPLPPNAHSTLFGDQGAAAYVTYFDAWYVPGSAAALHAATHAHLVDLPLWQDVITVHHPLYYATGGTKEGAHGPWDFDDPNPVPFISATGAFLVAVAAPTRAWADFALDLLARALAGWGVGAKTAAGYGRLDRQGAATPSAEPERPGEGSSAAALQPAAATLHPVAQRVRALKQDQVKGVLGNIVQQEWTKLDDPEVRTQVAVEIARKVRATPDLRKWGEHKDRYWLHPVLRAADEAEGT